MPADMPAAALPPQPGVEPGAPPETGPGQQPEPLPAAPPGPATLALAAFGQRLELMAPGEPAARAAAERRLRTIHEPALCAWALAPQGVALDIGAGFGAFALPFARAFPGWTVWCFEPDPARFALLEANIAATGATNVRAVPCAVGGAGGDAGGGAPDMPALTAALEAGMSGALAALCPAQAEGAPLLPAAALAALAPRLLKLEAPGAEAAILEGLAAAPLDHVLGELAAPVPSRLLFAGPGLRQAWLPVAGVPLLRLRRSADPGERRPGLDVVVALRDARAGIEACVDGLLDGLPESLPGGGGDGLRVLVVDDGATDGAADLVHELYGHDRRVVLLRKTRGGRASARNYGRLMSDAAHIAFVDAEDVPGPGLFAALLELARYTGAEVVQGGLERLETAPDGSVRRVPEAADAAVQALPRRAFGGGGCRVIPAGLLMAGAPAIWPRVYRRDFLDNRNIWFPEHMQAFDDAVFQLATLHHARNLPTLDHAAYGRRTPAGGDAPEGDERAFHALAAFRLILKRALREGWEDFAPMRHAYVGTVNRVWAGLRADLQPRFARAAAELWVILEKAQGAGAGPPPGDGAFRVPGLAHHAARLRHDLAGLDDGYAWAWLDSAEMHAPAVRAAVRAGGRSGRAGPP